MSAARPVVGGALLFVVWGRRQRAEVLNESAVHQSAVHSVSDPSTLLIHTSRESASLPLCVRSVSPSLAFVSHSLTLTHHALTLSDVHYSLLSLVTRCNA